MNELEKLEQKQRIYATGQYILSQDSYTNEVLNPEFEAIDRNLYEKIKNSESSKERIVSEKMNKLFNTGKINLGGF